MVRHFVLYALSLRASLSSHSSAKSVESESKHLCVSSVIGLTEDFLDGAYFAEKCARGGGKIEGKGQQKVKTRKAA